MMPHKYWMTLDMRRAERVLAPPVTAADPSIHILAAYTNLTSSSLN